MPGRRVLLAAASLTVAVAGAVMPTPVAVAQDCAPGFVSNPYSAQCLAPVITPVINGVPCVPSKLGLCQSFLQNQQPPRAPRAAAG